MVNNDIEKSQNSRFSTTIDTKNEKGGMHLAQLGGSTAYLATLLTTFFNRLFLCKKGIFVFKFNLFYILYSKFLHLELGITFPQTG